MKQKSGFSTALKNNLISILMFAVIAAVFLWGLADAEKNSLSEGKRIAQESILRAVVTCYSIEGSYPESYEYLKQHYGLGIDETRYTVIYEIFAENIMPEITVIDRKGSVDEHA